MPRPIQYGQRARLNLQPEGASPTPAADRTATILEAVLRRIGRPDDLLAVDVRPLWDADHYRVNVFRTVKGQRKLTDSYFIHAVADGMISTPPLELRYYDDRLQKIYADRP